MTLAFGTLGAKSAGGTTTVSVAYPASIAAGDLIIAGRSIWLSTATCTAETGWTTGPDGTGGVNSASGDHTTRAHADYLEATGSESGSVTFDQGGTISGAVGQMIRYTKGAGTTWSVLAVTGRSSDGSHGANRGGADTTGTIDIAVGDIVVAVVSVDTNTSLTITSPLYQVAGGTGRSLTRRTSGAGVATGLLGNVEIFDRVATNAESGVIAFGMTTATLQCGAAVFMRLREVSAPSVGTASGSFTFTGSAIGARTPKATSSGTVTFTGSAAGKREPKATVTGSLTWTGSAVGSAPGVPMANGTASGSIAWTGSATGKRAPKAAASGSITFAGTAAGKRSPKATAAGSLTYTGTAVGKRNPKASTSGSIGWVGTAVGQAPLVDVNNGTATGTLTWTGTATGRREPRAAALGTLGWAGTATGYTTRTGLATGTTAWTGSAQGARQANGTATGLLEWVGAATGARFEGPSNFTLAASVDVPQLLVSITTPTISANVTTPTLEVSIE